MRAPPLSAGLRAMGQAARVLQAHVKLEVLTVEIVQLLWSGIYGVQAALKVTEGVATTFGVRVVGVEH